MDIEAGARWPLFQKYKMAERLVSIEVDFLYCDIFFQMERIFLTGLFLHLPILLYQNVLEKSLEKFQEICSGEVHLHIEQRLLHYTVYKMKTHRDFWLAQ